MLVTRELGEDDDGDGNGGYDDGLWAWCLYVFICWKNRNNMKEFGFLRNKSNLSP